MVLDGELAGTTALLSDLLSAMRSLYSFLFLCREHQECDIGCLSILLCSQDDSDCLCKQISFMNSRLCVVIIVMPMNSDSSCEIINEKNPTWGVRSEESSRAFNRS